MGNYASCRKSRRFGASPDGAEYAMTSNLVTSHTQVKSASAPGLFVKCRACTTRFPERRMGTRTSTNRYPKTPGTILEDHTPEIPGYYQKSAPKSRLQLCHHDFPTGEDVPAAPQIQFKCPITSLKAIPPPIVVMP